MAEKKSNSSKASEKVNLEEEELLKKSFMSTDVPKLSKVVEDLALPLS